MPYIDPRCRELAKSVPVGAGELDYRLTLVVLEFLDANKMCFETMNTIVGVLDNVKDEFRRRILHPYEDKQCLKNGEVYPSL